ncbi:MAG TPA: NPCBM/NEW2 domain-containing protein, partial [Luteolibacter sp.]
ATSQVLGGDDYELRITGLRDGGKQWQPTAVSISSEDTAAGVTLSYAVESGILRIKLAAPVSRDVRWQAKFSAQELKPESVSDLKAAAPAVYQPVMLSWQSDARFHTITRDGKVLAEKYFGRSFTDASAAPGNTHVYTVAADSGNTPLQISVTVPPYPATPPAPNVKLGDLVPASAHNGFGGVQVDKAADGAALTVGKEKRDSGLGLHAPARIVYTRLPEWKRFVSHIGLNETKRDDGRASIVCKVISLDAAGKETVLAVSPVMRFADVDRFPLDVTLPDGCVKLALVVEDAADGIACDHANWCDAGFIK